MVRSFRLLLRREDASVHSGVEVVLAVAFITLAVVLFALAMAEASLLRVRGSQVTVAAKSGDRSAERLATLLNDLPRTMNAVLLAVLLGQVTATSIAGTLASSWFGGAGVTVATILVTVILFIYGEAIPKTLAIKRPYRIARRLSRPIRWLSLALRPAVSALVAVAEAQMPRGSDHQDHTVSEEELLHLTDQAASAGEIEASDAELIERSFTLGDLRAEQIMVRGTTFAALDGDLGVESALRLAIESGHRRFPVYRGGIDHIIGLVRLRDLADAATTAPDEVVSDRVRDVLTVSPTMPAIDLIRRMQSSGCHLAVVVDAHRSVKGIVTIEDAIEELIGTINEE